MRVRSLALLAALALAVPAVAAAQTPPAGDAEAGKGSFDTTCRGCHGGMIAPNLKGVVGRKIASHPEYPGYSAALKAKSAEVWGDENLHAFLADPNAFAPGTTMPIPTPDATTRANIIAYLKTLKPAAE